MFFSFDTDNPKFLTDENKAAILNLAFFLEEGGYDEAVLWFLTNRLTEGQKHIIYDFWASINEVTQRAFLCMADYEGKFDGR